MDEFHTVPEDFPFVEHSASTGAQTKYGAEKYVDTFFASGSTPPERHLQWCACMELANLYGKKCLNAERGKFAHLTQEEILVGYFQAAVQAHRDIAVIQLQWTFRRIAVQLGWAQPDFQLCNYFEMLSKAEQMHIEELKSKLAHAQSTEPRQASIVEQLIKDQKHQSPE